MYAFYYAYFALNEERREQAQTRTLMERMPHMSRLFDDPHNKPEQLQTLRVFGDNVEVKPDTAVDKSFFANMQRHEDAPRELRTLNLFSRKRAESTHAAFEALQDVGLTPYLSEALTARAHNIDLAFEKSQDEEENEII